MSHWLKNGFGSHALTPKKRSGGSQTDTLKSGSKGKYAKFSDTFDEEALVKKAREAATVPTLKKALKDIVFLLMSHRPPSPSPPFTRLAHQELVME